MSYLRQLLNGKKTHILVILFIGIVIHMIYTEMVSPEWGLLFIAGSLIPLAQNAGNVRRHNELKDRIGDAGVVPVDAKTKKTQWD